MSQYTVKDQLEILKKHFNNYSITLSSFMSNIAPKSSFVTYSPYIEKLANENSNKIIDTFVLSALKYEDKIMNNDESFFLGKNYDNELNNENDKIVKVFEFKQIWGTLGDQNKLVIKSYMQLLCRIARKYFNLMYDDSVLRT